MGRKYLLTTVQQSITTATAQDLLAFVPTTSKVLKLCSVIVTQSNKYGDANASGQQVQINRGTVGSTGGATVTPRPVSPGDAAATFTARSGDTTIGTSLTELVREDINIQAGFRWNATEKFEIEVAPSATVGIIIKLVGDPASAATSYMVYAEVEELG